MRHLFVRGDQLERVPCETPPVAARAGAVDLPTFARHGVEMNSRFARCIQATKGPRVPEGPPQPMPARLAEP